MHSRLPEEDSTKLAQSHRIKTSCRSRDNTELISWRCSQARRESYTFSRAYLVEQLHYSQKSRGTDCCSRRFDGAHYFCIDQLGVKAYDRALYPGHGERSHRVLAF